MEVTCAQILARLAKKENLHYVRLFTHITIEKPAGETQRNDLMYLKGLFWQDVNIYMQRVI